MVFGGHGASFRFKADEIRLNVLNDPHILLID